METKPNRQKLRVLMSSYNVKGPEVAALLGRKPGTVNVWMCGTGNDILDETLFYLEHLLSQKMEKCA